MKPFMAVAKAVADESRVRVLMFLRGGELCVCQIIEMLGLAPSTVSKHMSVLAQAGLVESRKEGRWVYYRLPGEDAPPCVRNGLAWVDACLRQDGRVQEDGERLRRVRCMSRDELCAHYGAGRRLMADKTSVLFLCTGNACRSQMAEGWTRHLQGNVIEPFSAGVAPAGLDPRAVRVMAEAGIDISHHRSKHVSELAGEEFDVVITVCDSAREACPVLPGAKRVLHVGFDDPPWLARDARTEEEALGHYRRVRDEVRAFVERLPQALEGADEKEQ